jgi:hypothetical protein
MDHPEAHERIADLALERGGLRGLVDGRDPALQDLRAHLVACAACRDDVDAYERIQGALEISLAGARERDGAGVANLAAGSPIPVPASLREAVRAIPGRNRASAAPPQPLRRAGRLPLGRLLAMAATLAIVVTGGGLLLDQTSRLDTAHAERRALQTVTATMDRVLQDPVHWAVTLTRADGSGAGTLAWSSHDIVVVSTALAPPPAGSVYRCWIERAGVRSPIGEMRFAGETGSWTAYWVGSLSDWATTSLGPGSTFGVSLAPAAGGPGGPPVITASLGS